MKRLRRPVWITGVVLMLAGVMLLSGCHLFRQVSKASDDISVSGFYKTRPAKDLERFNRDLDPTNAYN